MHMVIVGAGPGGYVAAIRAAQLGAQVTVIEEGTLGGVCLHWGCIPSKAMLACLDVFTKVRRAGEFGVVIQGEVTADLESMIKRKDRIVQTLTGGIRSLFTSWGIQLLEARGDLLNARQIRAVNRAGQECTIDADAIVLATGSRAAGLSVMPVDGKRIFTSKELLDLIEIPKTLVIVGAGVEGCEFASLFSGLGTRVILIEALDKVLPREDAEVSDHLHMALKKQGVTLHLGVTVSRCESAGERLKVSLSDGTTVEAEKALVSVGRAMNTNGLGLDRAGVASGERGEILVNDRLETSVAGIYAIGDVTGRALLAHVASAHGKTAVRNALGHHVEMDHTVVPAGIFTVPEIGRVGFTEDEARRQGFRIAVGRFRPIGLGKAHAHGETAGLFKVIADAHSGRILGAHLVGSHAADLIHEAAIGMRFGATAEALANVIHAHPTWAEGVMEAAEDVDGFAIHHARKTPDSKQR